MATQQIKTLTNHEKNTPLPDPGYYTLKVESNGTTHAVRVTDDKVLQVRAGTGDWGRPDDVSSITDVWNGGSGCWTLMPIPGGGEYITVSTPEEKPVDMTPGVFYSYGSQIMMALSKTDLTDINGNLFTPDAQPTVDASPEGSPTEWSERTVLFTTRIRSHLKTLQRERSNANEYLVNLKQAILEKAEEHEWCSEYDEFAEEWDLTPRVREYEVTVSVTVRARDEDEAEALVEENTGLSSWDDYVINGPDFNVSMV